MDEQKVIYPLKWNTIQPLKSNKVLAHATVYMNFENIMLSEIIQTLKTTCFMIPLSEIF